MNKNLKTSKSKGNSLKKKDKTISINPATGEKLAEFSINTVDELRDLIQKARIAQPQWGAMPVKKRIKYVIKVRDYLVDHIDELNDIVAKDNGKSVIDALVSDIINAVFAVSFYCRKASKFLKSRQLPMGNILLFNKRSKIYRVPFGVVGIISPWNYPFSIAFSEVIMALLAGNAVVLKTASETQMIGYALKKCIESAGLPENVFNYVNMPGSVAGDAFLESGIDKLFFTGSVPVGKYLMKKASETLTPVSLELGGKDPMIVCEDADLERAAGGALWAGFHNTGQACGGIERIYVQEKVYDKFLGLLKERVEALRIGEGVDCNTDIGAMVTDRQLNTVQEHIKEAVKLGATIFAQSTPPKHLKGQFIPCVVLTDVNHNMKVMKDETFGPVVGVMPYKNIDEAIRLANDSCFGLTASVWSKDHKKAINIGRRILAGAVNINDHLMSHAMPETPWGGFKESGIGRTHGDIGFAEMTQPQVIINDILPFVKKDLWWHPFSKKIYDGLRGGVYFLYGKGIFVRIKGFISLLKIFIRVFRKNS